MISSGNFGGTAGKNRGRGNGRSGSPGAFGLVSSYRAFPQPSMGKSHKKQEADFTRQAFSQKDTARKGEAQKASPNTFPGSSAVFHLLLFYYCAGRGGAASRGEFRSQWIFAFATRPST